MPIVRPQCTLFAALLMLVAVDSQSLPDANSRSVIAERVLALTRESSWHQVASVPVGFRTFLPQGMVKIGDALFVSSVEVRVPTKRFATPEAGHDRDPGEGVGHLFKMSLSDRDCAGLQCF